MQATVTYPEPSPRRPGIDRLVAEIQRRNPSWSMQRACIEAKHQWHDRRAQHAGQKGGAA